MKSHFLVLRLLALVILLVGATAAWAVDGSEPRNLAVSPDGDTILITSFTSNSITQFHDGVRSHILVGGNTWGVCFVNDNLAVVTHHDLDRLTVLYRTDPTAPYDAMHVGFHTLAYSLQYSTDVCANPDAAVPTVYVANRGVGYPVATPATSWRHTVFEIEFSGATPTLARRFGVDREPRALAVATAGSPSTSVLYVGHIQGSLGRNLTDDPLANTAHDGGTVLAIDLATAGQTRFAIGSPVRDVAVRPDGGGGYRVFCTHVGEAALSEDPLRGGIVIPNVITSFGFNASHVAQDRENIIINHLSELTPADNAAVVPEQIAFTAVVDGALTHHFAWITNAASGSVTRLVLQADGHAMANAADWSLIDFAALNGSTYEVFASRNASNGRITLEAATIANVDDDFLMPLATDVTIVPVDAGPAAVPMSSVPRGVVAHPTDATVLVVTQFDNELLTLSADDLPGQPVSVTSVSVSPSPVDIPVAKRNFFAAGAGFAFREVERPGSQGPIPPVPQADNLACITCHPDVHHDGKLHVSNAVGQIEPVVTPTLFDTGNSEWLFFNGLRTVVDDAGGCGYCLDNSFFFDTKSFTIGLDSPASPHAPDAPALTAQEEVGRGWFDAMNCSRCHQGVLESFTRTNEPAVPALAPLVENPVTAARLLSDRSQSFVTFDEEGQFIDGMSNRNRTGVGTRSWEGSLRIAVNTPVLAGAWDNRPYMHDGRYSTLDAVLNKTWLLNERTCGPIRRVAAPIWGCRNLGAVPDNFSNKRNIEAGEHLTQGIFDLPFTFNTHSPGTISGRVTVKSYLTGIGGYDDLVAFLLALSAETDPCAGTGGLDIANLDYNINKVAETTTVFWSTTFPAECFVTATLADATTAEFFTEPALSHELTYDFMTTPVVALEITSELRLCGDEATTEALVPVIAYGWEALTDLECTESVVKWKTPAPVASLFEWGPKNRQGNYAYSIMTPAGYSQELTLQIVPGGRYMARITPQVAGAESVVKYWNAFPCARIQPGKDAPQVVAGLQGIHPNPFNPATTIAFGLTEPGQVRIRVYDLAGRLVRTLADRVYPSGNHELMWNGRDGRGSGIASGTYLVRFEAGDLKQVKRIALLK